MLGDGISFTRPGDGVLFDIAGNGRPVRLSWTNLNSDDAWLVLDRNGNGRIDGGNEMFGNFTPQPDPPLGQLRNGFLALRVYDLPSNGGNNDGVIDQNDSIYGQLRLWQDQNHNGTSEASELHTLVSLGVVGLDLNYMESRRHDQYGNAFRYRAKLFRAKHSEDGRWAWDVVLRVAPPAPLLTTTFYNQITGTRGTVPRITRKMLFVAIVNLK